MRWQFSARVTSLIGLVAVSLAVGGAALGMALTRDGSAGTGRAVATHVDERRAETGSERIASDKRRVDKWSKRKGDADHYQRGDRRRGTYHDWWGSRRVIVVPRLDGSPRPFFGGEHPFGRDSGRAEPERPMVRPGGMVIAVGEVTAVHEDTIQMYTVLGNDVTIDVSRLPEDILPEVGASAIVIAERDDDRYIAQSLSLLDMRLSDMLEGMRARSRSRS